MPLTTAVILAAGRGTRLGLDVPKGLLTLEGQQLVPRSIAILRSCGIRRIIVVTGFAASRYEQAIGAEPDVVLVHNHRFSAGSLSSLLVASPLIDDEFLLLESDLIYESRSLSSLLDHPAHNLVLATSSPEAGDEVWLQTRGDLLTAVSKDRTSLEDPHAVLVGITKVSRQLLDAMAVVGGPALEYEHALVAAAATVPVEVTFTDVVWAEIDDATHLARAREVVVPRLRTLGEWPTGSPPWLP